MEVDSGMIDFYAEDDDYPIPLYDEVMDEAKILRSLIEIEAKKYVLRAAAEYKQAEPETSKVNIALSTYCFILSDKTTSKEMLFAYYVIEDIDGELKKNKIYNFPVDWNRFINENKEVIEMVKRIKTLGRTKELQERLEKLVEIAEKKHEIVEKTKELITIINKEEELLLERIQREKEFIQSFEKVIEAKDKKKQLEKVEKEIEEVEAKISKVKEKIEKVDLKIEQTEKKLTFLEKLKRTAKKVVEEVKKAINNVRNFFRRPKNDNNRGMKL
ncbi:MAG: hypothetical protein ACP5SD_09255 [Elusimicrobiales bacterium]